MEVVSKKAKNKPTTRKIEKNNKVSEKPYSAKDIVGFLNKTMVGQHKAKRHMAVGIVNHYKLQ